MLTLNQSSPLASRHVVVMGSGGFVGRASSKRLQADGDDVVSLTRGEVDLLACDAAQKLAGYLTSRSVLVVTSALAPVKNSEMLIDNLRMMRSVIEAVKASAVAQIVYISSDAVYGDSLSPMTESAPAEPGSLHGVMHLARELMLRNELPNIPQAVVRPTLIFGAGDPHNGYGPNRFVRLAKAGTDITLFGEGEERRDHVSIDDVAEIVRRCVRHQATGVVNAVSGKVTSFREIAEWVASHVKPGVSVKGTPRNGPMPHGGYRAFDTGLLTQVFPDFKPVNLYAGLEKMCAEVSV